MMNTKRRLSVLLSLALSGYAHAGMHAAVIRFDEKRPTYLYTAQAISPAETVYFQFPKNDAPTCCRQASGKTATLLTPDPDATDTTSDRKLYRYRLAVTGISTSLPFLGIAVIGSKVSVEQDGGTRIEARSGMHTNELLLCTSQEGVHLVSRSGDKKESHLYLYLGYDIDNPTCTPEQLK